MLLNSDSENSPANNKVKKYVGEHVIVRCRDAGVHYGVLENYEGRAVELSKSRRMYRWWSKKEMTLNAVAEYGLNESKSELRIQNEVKWIILPESCEIIHCSQECVESFARVSPYDEQ